MNAAKKATVKQVKPAIQSVDRSLAILERLSDGPQNVGEVAEALGIHKSTAFRLLVTLESRGFVSQESGRGKYRLGMTLVHLAASVTADLDLLNLARPICKTLSETTQETVNIAVLEGNQVVNVDQVIGSAAVVSVNRVGKRNPVHCTSTGKVLLAFSFDATKYLQPLESCTQHSLTKKSIFSKSRKHKPKGKTVVEIATTAP